MPWNLSPAPPPPVVPADPTKRTNRWSVIVPPVGQVVTVAQLRTQSRIDLDDGDTGGQGSDLTLLIQAATEYAEATLGASLLPQTIQATLYDVGPLRLPRGPVIGILSVLDASGAAVGYALDNIGKTCRVNAGFANRPVTITYRAGFVAADGVTAAVPAMLRLAILQHAASLYEHRESVAEKALVPVPHALEAFYAVQRRTLRIR